MSTHASQVSQSTHELETQILTSEARRTLEHLHRAHEPRRREVLAERVARRSGSLAEVIDERGPWADPDWYVAPVPPSLTRRHVELVSPVTRRFADRARHSGADVWLADLEDSFSPTWRNVLQAHRVLADAVAGEGGPVLMLRPRGLHLDEAHLQVDGAPVPASLADVGLFLHHHGTALAARAAGPYLYLPKLESASEARWWREVIHDLEDRLGLDRGTVKVTILIETLPAALAMEEILYELREHAVGLNAGRWDYLFSVLKEVPDAPLPDREDVTMTSPFMRAFTERLVAICHRRGAHAIAGPTAVLPQGQTPRATGLALARARADADTFAQDGFDGSWVAHPDLVGVVRGVYAEVMHGRDHQLSRVRTDHLDATELLDFTSAGGARTMEGLRSNVKTCVHYLAAWLTGVGGVALDGVMEDAATAEIARMQVRQWLRQEAVLDEGFVVTTGLVRRLLDGEAARVAADGSPAQTARLDDAVDLVAELLLGEGSPEFLTELAYPRIV